MNPANSSVAIGRTAISPIPAPELPIAERRDLKPPVAAVSAAPPNPFMDPVAPESKVVKELEIVVIAVVDINFSASQDTIFVASVPIMGSFEIVISPAAPVIRVSIPFSTKLVFSLSHIPPISPAIAFFMTSTAVDKSSIHGSPPIAVAIPSPSFRKFSTVAISCNASINPVMNALRNSPSAFQSKLPRAVPMKFPILFPTSSHGVSFANFTRAFISLLRNVVSFNAFVVHSKS